MKLTLNSLTKKILLYGINFSPELIGIGRYTGEMATWLAERGYQVRVVTALPYYPAWRIDAGFKNAWSVEDLCSNGAASANTDALLGAEPPLLKNPLDGESNFQVWRCPLWVPARPRGLKRLLHLASFALTSFPVMLRQIFWRPDAVWVVEPALFCAPAALVVARLSGARAWLHVQDFEVDAAFQIDLLRGVLLRHAVSAAERWLMRQFDVVSTISKRMHQRLLDKGLAPSNVRLAINWVNVEAFALPSPAGVATLREELGADDDTVVALYSGNMGGKQGLEVLADVARICLAEKEYPSQIILFVFCGDGAGRADFESHCQGLGNVRFLDLQPTERLPDLLAAADIHLLPQRHDIADLVMPSKLTGMLASARPVVAAANLGTELADVLINGAVANSGTSCELSMGFACGVVVPPCNATAFATAVQDLAADAAWREQLGKAGYLYAKKHLDRDAVLKRFEFDLLDLLHQAP